MQNKRKQDEVKKGQPDWLMTYSDMVTLCLAFFVLLYSFSTLDVTKWKTVVFSLQGALGPIDGGSGILDGSPQIEGENNDKNEDNINQESVKEFLKYQEETKELEKLQSELKEYLSTIGMDANIAVEMEERGLVLRFQDSVLFEKSKADLLPQSINIMREISGILENTSNPIRIEGHTDDLPINTVKFPSNWELSTSRATNVLRFLINEGLSGDRLSAVGYGEYHPLIKNENEESRKKNRRVDIVLIRESLRANEPK